MLPVNRETAAAADDVVRVVAFLVRNESQHAIPAHSEIGPYRAAAHNKYAATSGSGANDTRRTSMLSNWSTSTHVLNPGVIEISELRVIESAMSTSQV